MIRICLVHPFDPAGRQVGGINTYIRDFCRFADKNYRILLVGIDTSGRLRLGQFTRVRVKGRKVIFLPIAQIRPNSADRAAHRLRDSLTLKFGAALLKRLPVLAPMLRKRGYIVDLRRVDFAFFPVLARLPFVQMIHGVGVPTGKSGSLLARFPWVQRVNEAASLRLADAVFAVDRVKYAQLRKAGRENPKIGLVQTWADPSLFFPTPLPSVEQIWLIYAGRLEAVKNPGLLFEVIRRLSQRNERIRFRYVGPDDPTAVPGFYDILPISEVVGGSEAAEVAAHIGNSHLAILCSAFEGLPRFIIEALRCGRPAVVGPLPQLRGVIRSGLSGLICERLELDHITECCERVIDDIDAGRIEPQTISASISAFSPSEQLKPVHRAHLRLSRGM